MLLRHTPIKLHWNCQILMIDPYSELTMEEDKLLKLSTCEAIDKQLQRLAELIQLSFLKIDHPSKRRG